MIVALVVGAVTGLLTSTPLGFFVGGLVTYFVMSFLRNISKFTQDDWSRNVETRLLKKKEFDEDMVRYAQHKARQEACLAELLTVGQASLTVFEKMPKALLEVDRVLDSAERDFKDGAFAPFWDSIEQATVRLGLLDEDVLTLAKYLKRYRIAVDIYEAEPPRFPIDTDSTRGMTAIMAISSRMTDIVRHAQCNFQFASIYELRKTNQLLVAGFTNLAQAIDGMGRRIGESIDGLTSQILDLTSTLERSLASIDEHLQEGNRGIERLKNSVEGVHATMKKVASDQADRHNLALEMLNNIQRRRRPSNFGIQRWRS